MKKCFLLTVIIMGIMAVPSLKGQFRIGPGAGFITETRTLMLSANANYDLPQNWGLLGEYDYIFAEEASHTWWGLDLAGTYTFDIKNAKGKLYGLAGLNLLYSSWTGHNKSYTGLDIGAGYRIPIGNKMELVPDAKITVGSLSYLRLGVKLMFGL
jgi:hypothetical protein